MNTSENVNLFLPNFYQLKLLLTEYKITKDLNITIFSKSANEVIDNFLDTIINYNPNKENYVRNLNNKIFHVYDSTEAFNKLINIDKKDAYILNLSYQPLTLHLINVGKKEYKLIIYSNNIILNTINLREIMNSIFKKYDNYLVNNRNKNKNVCFLRSDSPFQKSYDKTPLFQKNTKRATSIIEQTKINYLKIKNLMRIDYKISNKTLKKLNHLSDISNIEKKIIILDFFSEILCKYEVGDCIDIFMRNSFRKLYSNDGLSSENCDVLFPIKVYHNESNSIIKNLNNLNISFKKNTSKFKQTGFNSKVLSINEKLNLNHNIDFIFMYEDEENYISYPNVFLTHVIFDFNEYYCKLYLTCIEKSDSLIFSLYYNKEFYNENFAVLLLKRIECFINLTSYNLNLKYSDLVLPNLELDKEIKFNSNNTNFLLDESKTLINIIENIANNNQDLTALIFNDVTVKYSELISISNKVANYLDSYLSTKFNSVVCVMLEPSHMIPIILLGILKAGFTYLPLDPNTPYDRIVAIIKNSKSNIIFSESKYIKILDSLQWECDSISRYICIDIPFFSYNLENEKNYWCHIRKISNDEIFSNNWISSYTNQENSNQEMNEHTDHLFSKLKRYISYSKNVLEIGHSDGTVMKKVHPYVKLYCGIYLSNSIVEKLDSYIIEKNIKNVKLQCLEAIEVDQFVDLKFDIIILNNIVQYFENLQYFKIILDKCIQLLNNEGIIFIGDIMDLNLKNNFISSMDKLSSDNPRYSNATNQNFSNKLFLSKDFLKSLDTIYSSISNIDIYSKHFTADSELTLFRFDCILTIDKLSYKKTKLPLNLKGQDTYTELSSYSKNYTSKNTSPNSIAYILYTSGTTGVPKGVMVSYRNILNFYYAIKYKLNLQVGSKILAVTNHTFDINFLEILFPLAFGMTVIIANYYERNNPKHIFDLIDKYQIDTLQFTPSRIKILLDYDSKLKAMKDIKLLILGGEKLEQRTLDCLFKYSNALIYNMYGPTETTIWSTCKKLTKTEKITIGTPLLNTTIHILDESLNDLPIGFPGQLYISGLGVSSGYLSDTVLTAEKFIYNPFKNNEIMYKTGDIARWLANGEIEFLGRNDDQVKINGFRIEISEIEHRIIQNRKIRDAIVLCNKNKEGENFLCGYIVKRDEITNYELINYLRELLPEYMVPKKYIYIDSIPLTKNGKTDKKQLLKMKENTKLNLIPVANNKTKPKTRLEILLYSMWTRNLKKDAFGINDDYFELGGTSLTLIKLQIDIENEFDLEIPIQKFYELSTIQKLSNYITLYSQKINIEDIFQQINKMLMHNNLRSKLFYVHNKNDYVYYLFTSQKYKNKSIEYIKNTYLDYLPDHIILVDDDIVFNLDKTQMALKTIQSRLYLDQHLIDKHLNYLKKQIYKYINFNSKLNLSKFYECTYLHNIYYNNNSATILKFQYNINTFFDKAFILDTIIKVINNNLIFRSVLVEKNNKLLFSIIDDLNLNEIPFIDLSMYSEQDCNKFIDYLDFMFKKTSNISLKTLLYKPLIIKITEKKHKIIIYFSHMIFDQSSKRILETEIYNALSRSAVNKKVSDYDEYNKRVNKMNQYDNLKSFFSSSKYHLLKYNIIQTEKIINKKHKNKIILGKQICFKISIDKLHKETDFQSLSLKILHEIIYQTFGIYNFVLNYLISLRQFSDSSFSNIIGDTHTILYLLLTHENYVNNSYSDAIQNEINNQFIQNNVHLASFWENKENEFVDFLNVFKKIRIHFNFVVSEDETDFENIKIRQNINNEYYHIFRMYVYLSSKTLVFLIPNGIPNSVKLILQQKYIAIFD